MDSKAPQAGAGAVGDMVAQFNATSAWVVRWVLGERDTEARARIIQALILVCGRNPRQTG